MAGLAGLIHFGTGLLVLAGLPQDRLTCSVPQAPQIRINATTSDIRYDMTQDSASLTGMSGNALEAGPYAGRTDVMTGGLRADTPKMQTRVEIGTLTAAQLNQVCFWYKTIDVDIHLEPIIYVARENNAPGPCRDAVLEHERRHVAVDHDVMNHFAAKLGTSIQQTVNEVGAFGPVRADYTDRYTADLQQRIKYVADLNTKAMMAEMDAQQALVDSRAEYDRISAICQADPNAVRTRMHR